MEEIKTFCDDPLLIKLTCQACDLKSCYSENEEFFQSILNKASGLGKHLFGEDVSSYAIVGLFYVLLSAGSDNQYYKRLNDWLNDPANLEDENQCWENIPKARKCFAVGSYLKYKNII